MGNKKGCFFFFFKQKTAYEIVSRDWSSDVCSSDLAQLGRAISVIAYLHRIREHIAIGVRFALFVQITSSDRYRNIHFVAHGDI